MRVDEEKLFELGAEVSAAQDAVDSTAVLARARTGVLSASVGRKKSRGASLRLGLAAAALGAGAVAALLFSFADSELSFEVDGQPAEVGTFIRAEEQARTIFFADASRLSLHRGSHARVLEAGKERARVLIERGGADVYVTPGLGREWSVAVGPFEVRVVGTSFGVRWTPEERRFDLELRTGEVRVTGPMLGDGRSLRAGQSLVVLLEEGRVELHDGALPARVRTEAGDPPVTPSDAPFEPVPEEPVEVPEVSPVVVRRPSEERASRTQRADEPEGEAEEPSPDIEEPAPPTWRELARAGRYQDALAEADIEAILASGDAGAILRLGDAARLARRVDLAERAYRTVRERHGGGALAARAAFALGRLAFDVEGDAAAAARWFSAYLAEAPGGALARDAQGRLMEAQYRAGNATAAREAARTYLERYPNGPHRPLAESLRD